MLYGIVKDVIGIVTSSAVGVVAGNAIKATTPDDLSKYQKVMVGIGSFAITSFVGFRASKHVENMIDDIAEAANLDVETDTERYKD